MLRVLSCNSGIFGHASYYRTLAAAFRELGARSAVQFDALSLGEPGPGLLRSRIGFKLLCWRWPRGQRSAVDDHDYYRLRSEWLASSHLRWRIRSRLAGKHPPDVLHLHTQAVALRLAGWSIRRVPMVVSIDNTAALLHRDRPEKIRTSFSRLWELERRCFAAASHVVSWTQRAAHSVINDYGIRPDRVSVIHPTTTPEMFSRLGGFAEDRKRRAPRDELRLLFVGNDFERKGGRELLDALGRLPARPLRLDILSRDPLSLPDDPRIHHHRDLPYDSAPWNASFEQADVFVLPTREDCLPMAFVEAISAGLPLIGTNVMSVGEIVRDGVNAITVPPSDSSALASAIATLAESRDLRARLGAASRTLAETEFAPLHNAQNLATYLVAAAASATPSGSPARS